jgi:hypothetical protein
MSLECARGDAERHVTDLTQSDVAFLFFLCFSIFHKKENDMKNTELADHPKGRKALNFIGVFGRVCARHQGRA